MANQIKPGETDASRKTVFFTIYDASGRIASGEAQGISEGWAIAAMPSPTTGELLYQHNRDAAVNALGSFGHNGRGEYYYIFDNTEVSSSLSPGSVAVVLAKAGYRTSGVRVDFTNPSGDVWDELIANHTQAGTFGELCARPTGTAITDVGNTTTTFKTNLTATDPDTYRDSWCCFLSGSLTGQVHKVVAYNGTTKFLLFAVAFTQIPANGDRFMLVDR